MQVCNPLPARLRARFNSLRPSSMCIETLFQKKAGYLLIRSAGDEYPSCRSNASKEGKCALL